MKDRAMFDYSKLRGRIVEKYGTVKIFSKVVGMRDANLTYKLNGKTEFKSSEIFKICKLLDIEEHILEYFFTQKV